MTTFPDVTHLLFDHDGVLVDTDFWYFSATRDELAASGIELTFEGYLSDGASGLANLVSQLPESEREGFGDRRNRRYETTLLNEDIQIPGVENALAALKGQYAMAVVATSPREQFNAIHEHRNIAAYFDVVVTEDDYAGAMPTAERYTMTLDQFGIDAERALVIEDSAEGLGAATAAGIRCVIVNNDFTATQDFSGAAARIDHLTELPALLGRRMPGLHSD